MKKLFLIKNDFFCQKKSFGEKKNFVKKIVGKKEFSLKKKNRFKKIGGVKDFDEKNFSEKKIFS